MKPTIHSTLGEAREWLAQKLTDGETCPCCGQHAQSYRRRVNAGMVRTLGRVLAKQEDFEVGSTLTEGFKAAVVSPPQLTEDVVASRGHWVHLADVEQASRDVATTAYFGLFVQHADKRGWWKLTTRGREFLEGYTTIHKYAHVFDGKVRGYSGPQFGVYEIARGFDLEETLGGEERP